jgi:hypothetical protein
MMDASLPLTRTLPETFFAPLDALAERCASFRHCPVLPDDAWLRLGVTRALHDQSSGRGFLQQIGPQLPQCPQRGHFFEELKSPRRLQLGQEANAVVARLLTDDPFAGLAALADFDLYASDGHWHGAAVHDQPVAGARRAVGHFFCLNLRTQALHHLTAAHGQKEHDMPALKRLDLATLRLGAPKGRKVIHVYDCAGIDFGQGHRWKQAGGIYFIPLTKENMKPAVVGLSPFDAQDPINHGVHADELIATSQHVLARRIRYFNPVNGEAFEFLPNELTLAPGLIACLYLRRWDLEKVFDVLKNKRGEIRAWASAPTAKAMQAQFLCLAHNLQQLLERHLATAHCLVNTAELERREQRLCKQQLAAHAPGAQMPSLGGAHQRLTQGSVKLFRWLRGHFFSALPLNVLWPHLRHLYATL